MLNHQTHKRPCCFPESVLNKCNKYFNYSFVINITYEKKFDRNNTVYC